MEETLICETCKKDFTRVKTRGRKPKQCPSCAGGVVTEKNPTALKGKTPEKKSEGVVKLDFTKMRLAREKAQAKENAKRNAEEAAQDKIDRKARAGKYNIQGKKYTVLSNPVKVGDKALYVPTALFKEFSQAILNAIEVDVFGVDSAGAFLIQYGASQVPCRPNKLYGFKS